MNSHQGNLSVVQPNDLLGEAVVRQFSRAGATIGTWEFKNIFPVLIEKLLLHLLCCLLHQLPLDS